MTHTLQDNSLSPLSELYSHFKLHLVALRSTALSLAAGSRPAPLQPGMKEKQLYVNVISPGVDAVSNSQTFGNFPNPFSSCSGSASQQPVALSPSNPFSTASGGDSSAFVTSPTSVFPPSASFPAPSTQNAFHHESATNQETNGFASFPEPDSLPKVHRPMSVNPFTGNVYPSRGTSKNPFI
ncbi:hypothetical protein ATANTOWER_030846 [Ataeniobius toweri]|uniref:Uncharacterized protein n=1 Tax=Ataeniobius toweri TaxID=208326 RepID=A0ABU7A1R2_9TELE|nr:hypothetical protein [Ataeniobius toweri]